MAEKNSITVGHTTQLNIVVFNNEPVLTFDMIDKVHARANSAARDAYYRNKQRFMEGKHYHRVGYGDAAALQAYGVNVPPRGLTLITKRGYLLLVKSFTDDLAWDVQEQLVDYYFEGQVQHPAVETISIAQLQKLREQMENVTRYMKHDKASLAQTLYRSMKAEFGYDVIENLPAKDFTRAYEWLGSYQDIAHQVFDVTGNIERGFIAAIKRQQKAAPAVVYRDVLKSLQAPLTLLLEAA